MEQTHQNISVHNSHTLPETNIAPENGWLEYYYVYILQAHTGNPRNNNFRKHNQKEMELPEYKKRKMDGHKIGNANKKINLDGYSIVNMNRKEDTR